MSPLDLSGIASFETQFKKWKRLDSSLKALQKLSSDEISNVAKIQAQIVAVEKSVEDLSDQVSVSEKLGASIYSWQQHLTGLKETATRGFATELNRHLHESSNELTGRLPELSCWRLTIEVNFENLTAKVWWGPKEELLDSLPLSPERCARLISDLKQRMTEASSDVLGLSSGLASAYDSVCHRQNISVGEPIPIVDVMNEMVFTRQSKTFYSSPTKSAFTEYSRAQYSNDLASVRDSDARPQGLRFVGATRAYTTSKQGNIWIPSGTQALGERFSHIRMDSITNG
jgi:hypothetical protein